MKSPFLIALAAATFHAPSVFAATVFTENFGYADGPLVEAAGSPWATHSGTASQVDVTSNAVNVTFSESEDVNAPIAAPGTFYNAGVLTLTMTATFTALPGTTANYFTHFKDGGTSNFRGRVFATTTGAAAGSFRLGISNSSTSSIAFIETDYTLNSPLSLSMTWNAAAGTAALSVNGGTAVAAIDAANPLDISTVAFRQSTNIGTIVIDNVLVDASVAAVPEPSITFLGMLGLLGILRRRR